MQDLTIPPLVTPLPRVNVTRRVIFRSYRPSLIDLRFKGDPWVVEHDRQAAVCLGDFPLGQVGVSPLDVPSLNRFLMQVRVGQARRNGSRRTHKVEE
jgi:hypothetical protein